jgi:hypothetical protein
MWENTCDENAFKTALCGKLQACGENVVVCFEGVCGCVGSGGGVTGSQWIEAALHGCRNGLAPMFFYETQMPPEPLPMGNLSGNLSTLHARHLGQLLRAK